MRAAINEKPGRVCARVQLFDSLNAWWFNRFLISLLGRYHPCEGSMAPLALQGCTSGPFVLVCVWWELVCVCASEKEETRWGMSERRRGVTGTVFSKSQFNWTIVQFNLGLSGFTKAYKALLLWTIKQEKDDRNTCFGSHFLPFPQEKLLCSHTE